MYAQRNPPEDAPCHQCRVALREENEIDSQVYMLSRRQVVTVGQGHIIDISIPAVKIIMDLCGVKDQAKCLNQVLKVFHHFLAENKNES